jgi:asparagine synthase (glutamine-hydrolysing)
MRKPVSPHPVRPIGHGSFGLSLWQEIFRGFDFDHTRAAIEVRHPYLDLRVLRFLLQVPVLPWCRSKYLMRQAGRGRLPETVRRRRKKTIAGDPFRYPGLPSVGLTDPAREGLSRYVAILGDESTARESSASYWVDIRRDALAAWLRHSVSTPGAKRDF